MIDVLLIKTTEDHLNLIDFFEVSKFFKMWLIFSGVASLLERHKKESEIQNYKKLNVLIATQNTQILLKQKDIY